MRKISMTTSQYMKWGNEPDAFAKMAEIGFNACDFSSLANIHGDLYKLDRNEWNRVFADVKKNAASAGVELYQAHGPWVWPCDNETEEGRAVWMQRMLDCLDACERIECPHLVVHPIMVYADRPVPDEAEYLRINREFWETLLPHAEKHGITLLLENMPHTNQPIASPDKMAKFVESFHNPYFAMCLDTGHSLVVGQKLDDSVHTIGKMLKAFHVHDNFGNYDWHITPGFGVGDWEAFRTAVKETVDESVPLSLETGAGKLTGELQKEYLRFLAKLAAWLAN